jgi:hypothetical protein
MLCGAFRSKRTIWSTGLLVTGFVLGSLFSSVAGLGVGPAVQAQQDARAARFWQQLTSLLEPVSMPTMTDHRAYMTPGGLVIALHFDNMDLNRAENLNWVAVGLPGKFCLADQQRVEAQNGPGFTHFHDLKNDIHGGPPGTEGVWFIHVAVRDLQAPWGPVAKGVDTNFMPTPAPNC